MWVDCHTQWGVDAMFAILKVGFSTFIIFREINFFPERKNQTELTVTTEWIKLKERLVFEIYFDCCVRNIFPTESHTILLLKFKIKLIWNQEETVILLPF